MSNHICSDIVQRHCKLLIYRSLKDMYSLLNSWCLGMLPCMEFKGIIKLRVSSWKNEIILFYPNVLMTISQWLIPMVIFKSSYRIHRENVEKGRGSLGESLEGLHSIKWLYRRAWSCQHTLTLNSHPSGCVRFYSISSHQVCMSLLPHPQ